MNYEGWRIRLSLATSKHATERSDAEIARKFAFDRNRVADFFSEKTEEKGPAWTRRQQMLLASFSTDVNGVSQFAANPAFNRKIAAGILSCFPSDRFDSTGLPKSARMLWLEKSQDDTQSLVDELFEFEARSVGDSTASTQ